MRSDFRAGMNVDAGTAMGPLRHNARDERQFLQIKFVRLAHELYLQELPLIPRIMTEWAHSRTGIDIHPGAKIGSHFFIDHGTGVVIGETCEIGTRVKLYHGVTLGARSFQKDEDGKIKKGGKRHPTVEDDVTIYPNSTVLGGETVIGARSTIGGNVFLVQSVPADSLVSYEETQLHIVQKRPRLRGQTNGSFNGWFIPITTPPRRSVSPPAPPCCR